MKSLVAAILLLSTAARAQPSPVATMPHDLEGGGRACFGHFTHTDSRLSWKSTFTQCQSPFEVLQQDGLRWTLKVHKSKVCAYEVIVVDGHPRTDVPSRYWSVTGYLKASQVGKTENATGCGMLPVDGKEKTIAATK